MTKPTTPASPTSAEEPTLDPMGGLDSGTIRSMRHFAEDSLAGHYSAERQDRLAKSVCILAAALSGSISSASTVAGGAWPKEWIDAVTDSANLFGKAHSVLNALDSVGALRPPSPPAVARPPAASNEVEIEAIIADAKRAVEFADDIQSAEVNDVGIERAGRLGSFILHRLKPQPVQVTLDEWRVWFGRQDASVFLTPTRFATAITEFITGKA